MTWPQRFLAVPTSSLRIDATIAARSPKGFTQGELREIAATVPGIYERIAVGWDADAFLTASISGDLRERGVAETYARLFQPSSAGTSLLATYDGIDLIVEKGNHRIQAARDVGVPVLPVWVSAQTEAELDQVEHACAHRIEREATAYRSAHVAYVKSSQHKVRSAMAGRPEHTEPGQTDRPNYEIWP